MRWKQLCITALDAIGAVDIVHNDQLHADHAIPHKNTWRALLVMLGPIYSSILFPTVAYQLYFVSPQVGDKGILLSAIAALQLVLYYSKANCYWMPLTYPTHSLAPFHEAVLVFQTVINLGDGTRGITLWREMAFAVHASNALVTKRGASRRVTKHSPHTHTLKTNTFIVVQVYGTITLLVLRWHKTEQDWCKSQ